MLMLNLSRIEQFISHYYDFNFESIQIFVSIICPKFDNQALSTLFLNFIFKSTCKPTTTHLIFDILNAYLISSFIQV